MIRGKNAQQQFHIGFAEGIKQGKSDYYCNQITEFNSFDEHRNLNDPYELGYELGYMRGVTATALEHKTNG